MKRNSRIGFVTGSLGTGGAELQMLMLMEGLVASGYHCELFVLEPGGPLRDRLRRIDVPVRVGGYQSEKPLLVKMAQLLRAQWRLVRWLGGFRPQVLHAFLPLTNFMGALAGRIRSVPVVITSRRALNTHQDRHRGWRVFDRLSSRLSHRVVANCAAVKADTLRREGRGRASIEVVYNGLDTSGLGRATARREELRSSWGLTENDCVLLNVANLIPYKGHRELLKAVARLPKDASSGLLLLVGEDRGIQGELEQLSSALGIADRVRFLGPRDDVAELLAIADIYVSASHEEGFSNALLEALGAGVPIVATRVGGTPEMLEQGRLGKLVEPGEPVGMAAAIAELMTDSAKRVQLSRIGREVAAARYSPEKMVQAYLRTYQATLLEGGL